MVMRRHTARSEIIQASRPQRVGTPDLRDYSTFRNPGDRPSQRFDWDAALTLHARSMDDLGYKLSKEQKRRLRNA